MSWTDQAACTGLDTNWWFPTTDHPNGGGDNHGRQAKTVCAQCPVQLQCLVDALVRNEDGGIWGGAGEDIRRHLARIIRTATHDPLDQPAGCQCRWCKAVRTHFDALTGERTVHINRNGPGATHGRRVTYNRGCRCGACCFAVQLYGQDQKFEQRRTTA